MSKMGLRNTCNFVKENATNRHSVQKGRENIIQYEII